MFWDTVRVPSHVERGIEILGNTPLVVYSKENPGREPKPGASDNLFSAEVLAVSKGATFFGGDGIWEGVVETCTVCAYADPAVLGRIVRNALDAGQDAVLVVCEGKAFVHYHDGTREGAGLWRFVGHDRTEVQSMQGWTDLGPFGVWVAD